MIIEGHHVTVIDVYIYNMNIVIIGLWISNEFLLKILLEIISKAQNVLSQFMIQYQWCNLGFPFWEAKNTQNIDSVTRRLTYVDFSFSPSLASGRQF